jgi:hypothetical protein
VLQLIRSMPPGVLLFLGYAFLVLSFLGLFMRFVVDLAIQSSIHPLGIVWMLLLAYLIFTMTLVLQKKQAAYWLALGLASLSLGLAFVLFFLPPYGWLGSIASIVIFVVVVWGLRRPRSREWFSEP